MGGITTTLFQRPRDPNFNQTTLLLSGNFPTNGAQNNTFLDSSSNGFTITRNPSTGPNAPTQGTFSPFSQTGWSVNFNNANFTDIYAASSADFNFGSGDFTIECFFNPSDIPASGVTTFYRLFDTGQLTCFFYNGNIYLRNNAGSDLVTVAAHGLSVGIWYHLAFVRSSTTYSIYRNGVLLTSGTGGTITSASAPFVIGTNTSYNQPLSGYVSNFRVTTGQALYTTTFTPATSPLTTTSQGATASNVKLLTCQSNRFVDNSTQNTKTILFGDGATNVGTRFVQAFSPFAPSGAYDTTAVGGSGYFDGTGDYLSVPASSDFTFTGNFTIECWFYPTAALSTGTSLWIMAIGAGDNFALNVGSTSSIVYLGSAGGNFIATGNTIQNAWNHLAVVRSGSTVTLYINGNPATGTGTTSATLGSSTTTFRLGGFAGGISGYITNWRVNNGQALYTSAFTPPTSPLTTTSQNSTSTNTKLLLNFTNAGIVDATAKNVVETVGNAQISTTQWRFGGTSMSFDGTGDRLIAPNSQNTAFGTGDFTVEMWVYPNSFSTSPVLFDTRNVSTNTAAIALTFNTSGNPRVYVNGGFLITGSSAASSSAWSHLAMVKSSGTITLYLNGTSVGSSASSTSLTDTGLTIGDSVNTAGAFNGYIDDLRVTKGVARYTANFNVPTIGFTDR